VNNPIRKIMVYVDGTEQSVTAAQYAVCLASFSGAELVALYVMLALKKGVSIVKKRGRGNVNKEIVNAVNEDQVDLLVIGELSRIRSRRDEFYDETERAMRTVTCSVLIVKDDDRVWEMYKSLA